MTGPTLKSHQSSLLRQEPRHQQDSFCLNGTIGAGPSFVEGLTPHTNLTDEKKVTVNLFRSGALHPALIPQNDEILYKLADVTLKTKLLGWGGENNG